jgi:hypothetical protein
LKKLTLLIFSFICLGTGNAVGQFALLFNFEMTKTGAGPDGPLVLSGNKLFGEIQNCKGKNVVSCIYSIDTNGQNYKELKEFKHTFISPSLALAGNALFGMTGYGSPTHDVYLFTMNTDGSKYNILHQFTPDETPVGSLILSGSILYGIVAVGIGGDGYIFSINTDGTGFKDIFDIKDKNGMFPESTLLLSGNVLYGVMGGDEVHDYGCVFSVHTDGSGYKNFTVSPEQHKDTLMAN